MDNYCIVPVYYLYLPVCIHLLWFISIYVPTRAANSKELDHFVELELEKIFFVNSHKTIQAH